MFVGHVAVGLACKRINSEVNAGVLVFAAMLSDVLLFIFALAGMEFVIPPRNYAHLHYLTFYFPYSHGMAATVGWALATFLVFYFIPGSHKNRLTAALAIAAAVFSHFVLDAIVHVPEIPVWGPKSQVIGLGLWKNMPLALGVETAVAVGGTFRYLQVAKLRRNAAIAVITVVAFLDALTVAGMTLRKNPPKIVPQAITTFALAIFLALYFSWIDGRNTDRSFTK